MGTLKHGLTLFHTHHQTSQASSRHSHFIFGRPWDQILTYDEYLYKIKQKHMKHTTIYKMIQNQTKRIRKDVINETAIKQQSSYDLYTF
jgi:hypothetical protein